MGCCFVGGDVGGGEVVGTLLVAFVGGGFGPRWHCSVTWLSALEPAKKISCYNSNSRTQTAIPPRRNITCLQRASTGEFRDRF